MGYYATGCHPPDEHARNKPGSTVNQNFTIRYALCARTSTNEAALETNAPLNEPNLPDYSGSGTNQVS